MKNNKTHISLVVLALLALLLGGWGCNCEEKPKREEKKTTTDGGHSQESTLESKSEASPETPLPEKEPLPELPPEPPPELPPLPGEVETVLSKTTAQAGERVTVTCKVLDTEGKPMTAETTYTVTPQPQGKVEATSLAIEKVGTYKVACQLKDGSIKDNTPETLTIEPGDPVQVETTLSQPSVRAGDEVIVTCKATDAYDNPITHATYSVTVTPMKSIQIQGLKVTGTKTGFYDVSCQASVGGTNLQDKTPASLEITPGLPDRIVAEVDPKAKWHKPGEGVEIKWKVYDRYGNEIPNAQVSYKPTPSSGVDTSLAPVFTFQQDGHYQITVTVTGPTEGGKKVEVTVKIDVDGEGPRVVILFPPRAAMLTGKAQITVRGKVTDSVSGLAEFKVNGKVVTPNSKGEFSLPLTSKWGLNILTTDSKDKAGNIGATAQSFHWSSKYKPMNPAKPVDTRIDNALVARLNQKAIDDGNRSTLNDLASILEKVLNSLDLDALMPTTLVSGTYKTPPFGWPKINYSVTKTGKFTYAPIKITLKSRTGGLHLTGNCSWMKLPVKAKAGVTATGTVHVTNISIVGDIDISKSGTNPTKVTVRSLSVSFSKIKVNMASGLGNAILGVIVNGLISLFKNTIRKKIEAEIKKALPGPIKSFVDGFKLDTGLNLPSALGGKKLHIHSALNRIAFDTGGGTLAMTAAVYAKKGIADGKRGSLLSSGSLPRWGSTYAMGVGLSDDILNQTLYAVWFAGALKQDLSSTVLKGLDPSKLPFQPKDLKIKLDAYLPPVFLPGTKGYKVDLGIGDLFLELNFKVAGGSPVVIKAYLSAILGANVSLSSKNEIILQLAQRPHVAEAEAVLVQGLATSNPGDVSLLLEALVPTLMNLMASSIIQKFPIPTIDLSALGGKYGIPPGTVLKISRGKLNYTNAYLIITGDLQ